MVDPPSAPVYERSRPDLNGAGIHTEHASSFCSSAGPPVADFQPVLPRPSACTNIPEVSILTTALAGIPGRPLIESQLLPLEHRRFGR